MNVRSEKQAGPFITRRKVGGRCDLARGRRRRVAGGRRGNRAGGASCRWRWEVFLVTGISGRSVEVFEERKVMRLPRNGVERGRLIVAQC